MRRTGDSLPGVFLSRLGYTSFPDLQAALRKEIDERSASPLSLYETAGAGAYGHSTAGLVAHSSTLLTQALTQTLTDVTRHDFAGALTLPYDSLVPTPAVIETLVAAPVTSLGDGAHQHMKRGEGTARRVDLV
ncbi:hypothetical protein ACIRQF_07570 [Streptomyces sp. NPDC101191]|uniref:hypothetical protein n=1 Tax=Streptomyces sp. NPDC101191 TaxID=3366126 RepID=UPI00381EDE63